ncbi:MAG TPA: AAA family ATPase [Gaiellales bacterium]|nr:AAA family ATPase [Gaiellales bacterium]
MASDEPVRLFAPGNAGSSGLARELRKLTRAATIVAVLTSPAAFIWFHSHAGLSVPWALLWTFVEVIAFRGLVDIVFRWFIPWPSLFGADKALQQEDVIARRRVWFWRFWYRLAVWIVVLGVIGYLIYQFTLWAFGDSWLSNAFGGQSPAGVLIGLALQMPLLFLANFLIFFGPFLLMASSQIRSYEPGDADWGVNLDDVRGQAEAKEEVRRVVTLWQSGEAFEQAGGKRERGLLMLGAPGTGKTMLSKAIATGFNCPFVSIPGSGFAGMFLGMDAITVRLLARRAKKLARKWGGQCIVFIDEIDAVGMRRASLGAGMITNPFPANMEDLCFFGRDGALTPTGDLILETRRWRERLFEERFEATREGRSGLGAVVRAAFPGGMGGMFGGGQLALNQLLVVMDGIGEPKWMRKTGTSKLNSLLDATYVIPQRIGRMKLRLPKPRPAREQIYFIGACNAPIEALDPALIRPGRMGRHVWFRTPTKDDRKDIFDLYLAKVDHDDDLNTPKRRDELARITNGYSPAMVEQVCSMALTHAHYDGRRFFSWDDIVEAMTTVESGTAVNVEYIPEETRAVAIHEAGHAVASHVYMKGVESTRISIRKRGQSLGHHQALEKEERFSSWRHEEMGRLVWTLGAMAAERVFYQENSTGVGGDVMSATARAAWMVGSCAMGPEPVDVNGNYDTDEEREEARDRILKRFERIGQQIMRQSGGGGMLDVDPIAGVLSERGKRTTAAQLLGQAYVAAHVLIEANRDGVEKVASVLVERRELHGDEVVELLDSLDLKVPEVDLLEESVWPMV